MYKMKFLYILNVYGLEQWEIKQIIQLRIFFLRRVKDSKLESSYEGSAKGNDCLKFSSG